MSRSAKSATPSGKRWERIPTRRCIKTQQGGQDMARALAKEKPEIIVNAAVQEDVDAIGLSILSGAHNYLFPKVVELLKGKKMGNVVVFGGGIIPDGDIPGLRKKGVDRICTPATSCPPRIQNFRKHIPPRS